MTENNWCKYLCSYLSICTAAAWYGHTGIALRLVTTVIFGASVVYAEVVKKLPAKELLKAALLAAVSMACSWAFVDWLL